MKLIAVRHGRTGENVRGFVQGQGAGGPLDEVGKRQVRKLAERLAGERIDICYASELERALETARAVLALHPGAPLIPKEELNEKAYGAFEGLHRDLYYGARDQSGLPFYQFKPEGGETHPEVRERVRKFYRALFPKHREDTVLVVSHGAVLAILYLYLLKLPFEEYYRYHVDNTAMSIFEIDAPEEVRPVLLNSTDHLRGL